MGIGSLDSVSVKFNYTLSSGDIGALYTLMNDLPEKCKIVEIGSNRGYSTLIMSKGLETFGKKGIIYCIDPWGGTQTAGEGHIWITEGALSGDGVYDIFEENMKEYNVFDKIKPMKMLSEEAVSHFEDKSLDMVFIDGDHSYQSTYNDISIWYPKVKDGGIMCGHDSTDQNVAVAASTWANENNTIILGEPGTSLWKVVGNERFEMSLADLDPKLSDSDFGHLIFSMDMLPKKPLVVEIGSHVGASAIAMSIGMRLFHKEGQMTCVDIWKCMEDVDINIRNQYKKGKALKNPDYVYELFQSNIYLSGFTPQITTMRLLSKDAALKFKDNVIDYLFIDGTHTEEAVIEDITSWFPKVKIGGYINFHDYNFPNVRKGFCRFFSDKMKGYVNAASTMFTLKKTEEVKEAYEIRNG